MDQSIDSVTLKRKSDEAENASRRPAKKTVPGPVGYLRLISRTQQVKLSKEPSKLYTGVSRLPNIPESRDSAAFSWQNQHKDAILRGAPFRSLLEHLNVHQDLLNSTSLKWIRSNCGRFPERAPIPFVILVVEKDMEIVSSARKYRQKAPSIDIMDSTGYCSVAALTPRFTTDFGCKLKTGTAIALRNVNYLTVNKKLVLTISRRNIVCLIMKGKPEEEQDADMTESDNDDGETVTFYENQVNPFCLETVMEEFVKIKNSISEQKMKDKGLLLPNQDGGIATKEPNKQETEDAAKAIEDVLFDLTFLSDDEEF